MNLNPNDIIAGERLRRLNAEWVAELERSIATIGLQTPITIRHVDGRPTLIAGAHRLQAVKNLGWSEIPVHIFEGDDRKARMWEIAENLHRAELTVMERAEQVAEWIRLATEGQPAQVDPTVLADGRKAGPQHQEGGINQASRELGVERKAAQRAVKIDSLAPEAKAAAVELGLDDNQSALLQAAKAETADEQVEALQQRKERKPPSPEPTATVADEVSAEPEGTLDFKTILDELLYGDAALTGEQLLELADEVVSQLPEEQLNKLSRLQQWRRWEPTQGAFDLPHVPGYTFDRPMLEIKVIARNEWQTRALANEPTNPEEATIRYYAIGWETGVIEKRWDDLETASGKVLEDAKRFFPGGKGWKAWLKSMKTCRGTTSAINSALQHADYSPEGNPAPAITLTRLTRLIRELNDDRWAQLKAALERLIEKYTTPPTETATDEQPKRHTEVETPTPDLPFDTWLAQFKTGYAALTTDQQLQVEAAMGDAEAAARQPAEKAAA